MNIYANLKVIGILLRMLDGYKKNNTASYMNGIAELKISTILKIIGQNETLMFLV